ncbi:uncharacterized protein LOC130988695 [Salvia miltiorrhiza]|uniref:uncharacterized protein LOC130988695 n=1 Tax=Salvia miltiorrhiza TaxID=226208 RepID=UPI0025AD79A7|nr:uncharacterized protein LOC130988695 [Salvia miltiorrhiza]
MRFKSWPFLEDWKEVFDKDRATGANAEDIMEAMYKMYQADGLSAGGDNVDSGGVAGSNHHSNQKGTATDDAVDSVCQGDKKAKPARKSSKKRKANEEMDGVYKMLGEMCRDTGLRIDNLATRAGYDFDLGMARQTVFKQLGNIAGLTTSEKFDICEMLADKAQRLEIFIGLPDEAKAEYVERLLQSRNNQDRFP